VTAGGRVLCVTGWGKDLRSALGIAYSRIEIIKFDSMHYRKDIGWRALAVNGL
jgi:phosphoribosylamine--glycine ligase